MFPKTASSNNFLAQLIVSHANCCRLMINIKTTVTYPFDTSCWNTSMFVVHWGVNDSYVNQVMRPSNLNLKSCHTNNDIFGLIYNNFK